MIEIIRPDQFRQLPWKNGKGITTELAISAGGTLADFDWRLSMAQVDHDGPFSAFSGYQRSLVLVAGAGIMLEHQYQSSEHLEEPLAVARFDGGDPTVGRLIAGPITDFNVMTRAGRFTADVRTCVKFERRALRAADLCFVYGLQGEIKLVSAANETLRILPAGELMKISAQDKAGLHLEGERMIVIHLQCLA